MTFRALVFDVLGTVVDEDRSVRDASAALLASAGISDDSAHDSVAEERAAEELAAEDFAAEWASAHEALLDEVRHGESEFTSGDLLRQRALDLTLERHPEIRATPEAVTDAATVGHRLEPWPDSVAALARLNAQFAVIALTNGSAEQTAEMSWRAGLDWTEILTGDEVRQFKPHPSMYLLPSTQLGIEPGDALFVAAHPWDLDGAAEHGYRTALILRPGVSAPADAYDYQAGDLGDLADQLGR
ncbi:haloacid dehalogenase type II [soil metagenome]